MRQPRRSPRVTRLSRGHLEIEGARAFKDAKSCDAKHYPGGALGILDLMDFLRGVWRLTRTLEDRRAGQRGRLDGRAVLTPAGAGLVYRERGVLRLGAFTGPAERVYRYGFPAPGRAEVAFEDGRPFHDLDLSHGRWSVAHRCRDDLYRGSFEVEGRDRWTAVWRVLGPRKDLVLRGRYDRAG